MFRVREPGFLPSDDQDVVLLLRWLALDRQVPLSVLDVLLVARNVDRTVLLNDLELVQWVKSRRIFNITSRDAEASLIEESAIHLRFPSVRSYLRAMGK